MAVGTVNVNVTIIGPNIFGIKCFHIIRSVLEPSDLSASTYRCVRNRIRPPLTSTTRYTQGVSIKATKQQTSPLGKSNPDKTTTHKQRRPVNIGQIRIIYSSTLQPIQPDIDPHRT